MPIGAESAFEGFIDLLTMKEIVYGDDPDVDPEVRPIPRIVARRSDATSPYAMIEVIAETDEALTEKYLEGREISSTNCVLHCVEQLSPANLCLSCVARRSRTRACKRCWMQWLIYLPSPLDIPAVRGIDPDDLENKSYVAMQMITNRLPRLAFKIVTDPYVGRLAYIRVYSGKISTGQALVNTARRNQRERIGRLVRMHANSREEIEEVLAGDIAAIIGPKNTFTGDTLCDADNPILLEAIKFPEPVISVAIEPRTKADQDKMAEALRRLSEEDPTFRVRTDEETGQTLISGMGELHLDVLVDRMMREFKVWANVGKPQVAYRETITRPAKGEGRFVRQTGGRGQYGHAVLELEPLEKGKGFEFEDAIRGGVDSARIHPGNRKRCA